MPFERIDLRLWQTAPPSKLEAGIRSAVDALRTGRIAVLPTETVYGLAVRAHDSEAVDRLVRLKGRTAGHPFALAFSGINAVLDFVPDMSDLALRLARRCWPGPVSLVLDASDPGGEFHALPQSVQNLVSLHSTVSFRVPSHPLILTMLGDLNEPVILTSANRSGVGEAATIEEIVAQLGDGVDLLIDGGPIIDAKPSTIVKVDGDRYSILREGAVTEATLDKLTARMILFVCTGNTCRSPMAERICEMLLARRLDCTTDELENRGFVVLSAGVDAVNDVAASPYAQSTLQRRGLDLSDHRSQMLNETHVRFADHIFALTRRHRETILSRWPRADMRLNVLRLDGGDVSDPIGSPESVYEDCARQLETEIEKRLDEILPL